MKVKLLKKEQSNLSIAEVGKRIAGTTLAILLVATATVTRADVASRVLESNSTAHKGVLAYVHDASTQGRKTESFFFGQGLRKVSSVAPDFQIQIVGPEDIPGGAFPGSFVVLTPEGDRVVSIQRECKTLTELRALIAGSTNAQGVAAPNVVAYFEYDH